MRRNRDLMLACAALVLAFASSSQAMQKATPPEGFVDPSDSHFGKVIKSVKTGKIIHVDSWPDTLKLAIEQTVYARAVIYYPSQDLSDTLGAAALELRNFYGNLTSAQKIGLLVRLFGPEGFMPSAALKDALAATKDEADPDPKTVAKIEPAVSAELNLVLTHVGTKTATGSTARERIAVIALMGDVGALMTDTGATTGTKRSHKLSLELQTAFVNYALQRKVNLGLKAVDVTNSVAAAKKAGGTGTVGPQKGFERKRVANQTRTGIHNVGSLVDKAGGIADQDAILPSTWALAVITEDKLFGITEPMAGHMSASPSEILHTWDLLAGRPVKDAYLGARPNGKGEDLVHYARAAGADAFLIATGFHSSMEVLDGTLTYLWQPPIILRDIVNDKKEKVGDAGTLFYDGAATSLIGELLQDHVNTHSPKIATWLDAAIKEGKTATKNHPVKF